MFKIKWFLDGSVMQKRDSHDDFSYLKTAAVPMWAVYQFLISVVLLRILIVMMTITYRKIYDDLDSQWKYVVYAFVYV